MSDLKPGRELDALIAEKVFGLTVEESQKYGFIAYKSESPEFDYLHNYSTDISAAWEVFEKVKGMVPESEFYITAIPERERESEKELYEAMFLEYVAGWQMDYKLGAKGETAPHAVCLAALKAVGLERP